MSVRLPDLIDALGGPQAVAALCGVGISAVKMWKSRGEIPAQHALVVWSAALAAGIDWEPPGAEGIRAQLTVAQRDAA